MWPLGAVQWLRPVLVNYNIALGEIARKDAKRPDPASEYGPVHNLDSPPADLRRGQWGLGQRHCEAPRLGSAARVKGIRREPHHLGAQAEGVD